MFNAGLEHNHLPLVRYNRTIVWDVPTVSRTSIVGASWDEGKPVKFVDKMTSDQMTMHWEMFTYAIFKGGLIKHLSHSDNHQSQAVTMLICEVMTLIVSVSFGQ